MFCMSQNTHGNLPIETNMQEVCEECNFRYVIENKSSFSFVSELE